MTTDIKYDKLIKQSNGIEFYYDTTGLLGFKYKGVAYVYKKDIQGNVTGIIDGNGDEVVTYEYDSWGRHKIIGALALGNRNPFRYRGYYYDAETKLYYLQSRYYDPELCRFMTIDSINYADPDTINGLNLYAYCNNNPVNFADPSGEFLISALLVAATVLLFTPIGGAVVQAAVSTVSYVGMAVASLWDSDIKADMDAINWNPFNSDTSAVLNSNKVSFYKGAPVFMVSGMGGSMSLGAIWFDKTQGAEVLKHERGHNEQLMSMGLGNYLIQVGIPSVWKNGDNTPWELSASMLGNSALVSKATSNEQTLANIYYLTSHIPVFNIMTIFWYIFY